MTQQTGKFITFEGGEGLGKTTHIAFVLEYLQQQHISVIRTREPGGTELAEKIRAILLDCHHEKLTQQAELLLMFAARAQHLAQVIKPALASGQWVLCDRFTDATYAYQGGGRGLDIDTIACLETMVQGNLKPDLTLLLDAPIEIGMARVAQRGQATDRFEAEQLNFFQKVRQMYLHRAEQQPERIKIIDAAQSLTVVRQSVIQVVEQFIMQNS